MAVIRQRGEKFQAIVRVKRNGAIVHQESRTFAIERLAKKWAGDLEASLRLNGLPQRALKVQTVGTVLFKYLTALEAHGEIRRTRRHEIEQLVPYFDKLSLASMTAADFTEFATKRRAEGAGAVTVMHNLAAVRGALNAARAMFGLEVDGTAVAQSIDAMKRVGVVSPSQSRDRRPSQNELNALTTEFMRISAYPSTLIPMEKLTPLAVALPRRLGELTDMRWDDYDRTKKLILLRDTKHPTKPRNEVVPVPPAAAAIIDTLPVIDERILPYRAESVSKSFQRACDRLGIRNLRFHDLRHEGISRLFEQGLSIQEVAIISGHTSWAMLRRYTHLSAESLSEKLHAGVHQAQEARAEPSGP